MKICWFFVATNDTQGSPTKGNQHGERYTSIRNNQNGPNYLNIGGNWNTH
jgi:hypothetical protein